MHQKALLFNDTEVAELIMEQTSPRKQKMLGREVRGFDNNLWMSKCEEIMVTGLCHKFGQNTELEEILRATGDTIIVEASPYDKIWGIGMKMDDPQATDPTQWQGKNLLGKVLMEVREIFYESDS